MLNELMELTDWARTLVIMGGALVVGVIFETIVLSRFKQLADRTHWEGDDIIYNALKGMTTLWFVVGGLYFASLGSPIPAHFLRPLHHTLLIIVIFSATFSISRIAVDLISLYSSKAPGIVPSTSIFNNIAKLVIFSIGLLIILQSLGISVTPLLGALGVGGLAVALGLQTTLANLFSGIQIIASRQILPGDYVQLSTGQEGIVADITWRSTSIRTLTNNMYIIPNAQLATAIVTNYNRPAPEIVVLVEVGVSYGSDLSKVEQVTVDVAKEIMRGVPGGIPDFEPIIRFHTFDDSSIDFTVVMRAKAYVDQYLVKHEFIKKLKERYDREGINIPFPTRSVYLSPTRG